jgi:hypothetical protein
VGIQVPNTFVVELNLEPWTPRKTSHGLTNCQRQAPHSGLGEMNSPQLEER